MCLLCYAAMLKILPIMLIILLKIFDTVPMFCYFLMDNDKILLMKKLFQCTKYKEIAIGCIQHEL